MKKYYKIGARLIMYIIIWAACINIYNILNLSNSSGIIIGGVLIVLGEFLLNTIFNSK